MTLQKQSRPLLAIINEDYPKFRLVSSTEDFNDLINYLIIILNIKTTSEEENKNIQSQMIVILDFIKTKFGFLTIQEIREAFKMYVAKDFGHKEIYRNLDTIVVSDVLNCFMNLRAEKLIRYSQKNNNLMIENNTKLTDIEIEKISNNAVNKKFKEYIETKNISNPLVHIFQHLIDKKIIKMPSIENPRLSMYYDRKLLDAKIEIENELKSIISNSVKENLIIKEELNKIINNNSSKAEIRAKKLVLIDFFNKQINLGKHIIFD